MEWIKVEDRLPETAGMYLCYCENKKIVFTELYEGFSKKYESVLQFNPHYTVTHWMPLPEPPAQPKLTWQYELKSEPGVWKDATDDEYSAGCDLIRMNWRQIEK